MLSKGYETEWNETCLEGEDKGETWKGARAYVNRVIINQEWPFL